MMYYLSITWFCFYALFTKNACHSKYVQHSCKHCLDGGGGGGVRKAPFLTDSWGGVGGWAANPCALHPLTKGKRKAAYM
jgi:hypothetical protein